MPALVIRLLAFAEQLGEHLELRWDSAFETAAAFVGRLEARLGGGGLLLLVDERLVSHYDGSMAASGGAKPTEVVLTPASGGKQEYRPWHQVAGMLHSVCAQLLPVDDVLAVELQEHTASSTNASGVGVFLLKSPGRVIWRTLASSLSEGWRRGSLDGVALHVLVHGFDDWDHKAWLGALGDAWPLFRGIHWCLGERTRFEGAGDRRWENYFNKAFTMVHVSKRLGYKYLVSLDDDVFLSASAVTFLATTGRNADAAGCGVVAPLLQNGVPTVELWAEAFLSEAKRQELYACFEGSSASWFHEPWHSPALEPLPAPWDAETWYRRVGLREPSDFKGVHPVRGNRTCMEQALAAALTAVGDHWPRWRSDHRLIVDIAQVYPYLCNNAFLMRTDLYAEALERPDLQRTNGADEVPMNLLLKERGLPMCFVGDSFGLHTVYNHHPDRDRLETIVLQVVQQASWRDWSFN